MCMVCDHVMVRAATACVCLLYSARASGCACARWGPALYASVCAFWKKFDLDGRRHKLDQQALEMRARHDATVSGRRALTEATKTFFKGTKAERASGLRALLKRYQEEVDTLTRRARSSDKAFRDLFRALIDAPDPAAALQSAADSERRVAEASEEAERLRSEVAEYEAEFSTLKNQDITIRQLEERLRGFEDDVEQQVRGRRCLVVCVSVSVFECRCVWVGGRCLCLADRRGSPH